jgi:hypothetical protein
LLHGDRHSLNVRKGDIGTIKMYVGVDLLLAESNWQIANFITFTCIYQRYFGNTSKPD